MIKQIHTLLKYKAKWGKFELSDPEDCRGTTYFGQGGQWGLMVELDIKDT